MTYFIKFRWYCGQDICDDGERLNIVTESDLDPHLLDAFANELAEHLEPPLVATGHGSLRLGYEVTTTT